MRVLYSYLSFARPFRTGREERNTRFYDWVSNSRLSGATFPFATAIYSPRGGIQQNAEGEAAVQGVTNVHTESCSSTVTGGHTSCPPYQTTAGCNLLLSIICLID